MKRALMLTAGILFAALIAFLAPADWAIPVISGQDQPPAKEQPSPPPMKIKPVTVPASEKSRQNPVPNVPEAIEAGRILFTSQCHLCHGKGGEGKGELAHELGMTVPDLTSPKWQAKRTDGEIFYIVTHGHGDMPPEKRLAAQQMWETILFMRTLGKPAPKP